LTVNDLTQSLANRGPDNAGSFTVLDNNLSLHFVSTVLHIRGVEVSKQPFIDNCNNVLLWNGEVFGGLQVPPEESDTNIVASKLMATKDTSQLISVFKTIQGPWAVLYWQV
jgi:asparagine synthetase B (glutamine-hydrolysing)